MFWKEIGIIPTLNQIKDFTGSNPVLTTKNKVMYVIRIKGTNLYWKSPANSVDLQDAKIYKNKKAAEFIVNFYDNLPNLEIVEVEIKLK
jgi:hypothetical protein